MTPEDPAPLMVAPFRLDSLRERAAESNAPAEPTPTPSPADTSQAETTRRSRRRAGHRRRRRRPLLVVLVVFVVLVAAAGAFAAIRLTATDPPPTVSPSLAHTVSVPAATVTLPWPTTGQGAVAIPSVGVNVASGPQQPVPVASLTKLMTAYVVLHDHPLAPGEPGPSITVTQPDVDDYDHDTVSDDSNAQVTLGEQLTEQQVLGGLLVHSADNYADLIARWDAGSLPAFMAKMNTAAAALGMSQSHFADASGVDPGSQSTASDILKVAAPDMADPVFRSLVNRTSVTLPVAGTISTYTPLIGLQGIVGVKSGFTVAAGGCDVLGVFRTVHGHSTLLLAAVTGQTGPAVLAQAGLHGLALVDAAAPLIGTSRVLHGGTVAAQVTAAGHTVPARVTSSVAMLTWPGATAARHFEPVPHLSARARRGARVGSVVVTLGGQRVAVPVRLTGDVPRQTLLQRLF